MQILHDIVSALRGVFGGGPEGEQARFSAALIALAAKMAKADGVATEGEFTAFCEVFAFDEAQRKQVRSLYDLAKRDTAGFDAYARRIVRDFPDECALLEDVLDGLFHVAKADGAIHEGERLQLEIIADIFGFSSQAFDAMLARHVDGGERDPYRVLGIERDADDAAVKARYRKLMTENHPDKLMARGLPEAMIRIANDRVAEINAAWETVSRARNI